MEVIDRKTATLFQAGARLGLSSPRRRKRLRTPWPPTAWPWASLFQLVDDALDYQRSHAELGKNVGDDLDEGKPTLPVIRAIAVGHRSRGLVLRKAIQEGGREHIDAVARRDCRHRGDHLH